MFFKNSPTRFDLTKVEPFFKNGYVSVHSCPPLEDIQRNCRTALRESLILVAVMAVCVPVIIELPQWGVTDLGRDLPLLIGMEVIALPIAYLSGRSIYSAKFAAMRDFIKKYRQAKGVLPMLSRMGGAYIDPYDPDSIEQFVWRGIVTARRHPNPKMYEIVKERFKPFISELMLEDEESYHVCVPSPVAGDDE